MATHEHDLEDLFHRRLRQIWFAEKKIHAALPKMAKSAQSDGLRAALKKHEGETERQIGRLGTIFAMIDKSAKGEASSAIEGLINECTELMVAFKDSSALDAGIIAGAQAIEHYEITCYGTLKAWAEQLGKQQAVSLLDETLKEETATDEALTELAEDAINLEAQEGDEAQKARRRGRAA